MIILLQILLTIASTVICQKKLNFVPGDNESAPAVAFGQRAFQNEFPHMAAIGWTKPDGRIDYICGGSLLTLRFVLTVAHCAVDADNIPPDTARLGDTNLASTEDDAYAQQVTIERFIQHPRYNYSKRYYDIALIKLEKNVKPSKGVYVACVWRAPYAPNGLLDAVGFGVTGFGEMPSPTLQKVQLRELDTTKCAERLPKNRRRIPEGLRADQLCAHDETMDTCEGDSGGPLQTELHDVFGNVYPLVVGIVSFGTPCVGGSTGVYTRVSSYLNWIESEVRQPFTYEVCTGYYNEFRKKNYDIFAQEQNSPSYRVGLLWDEKETDIYQCGGLLIDYQYVLTSADCVTSIKGPPKFVASHPERDRAPVEDVFVHPRFVKGELYFDIAVIKLLKDVHSAENQSIFLWNEQLYHYEKVEFGATIPLFIGVQNSQIAPRSYVHSSLTSLKKCTIGETVEENDLVCISRNVKLIPGLCQVDYGGPVAIDLYENNFKVLGILSRTIQGCDTNVIFTSILPHRQWLESIIFEKLDGRLIFSD